MGPVGKFLLGNHVVRLATDVKVTSSQIILFLLIKFRSQLHGVALIVKVVHRDRHIKIWNGLRRAEFEMVTLDILNKFFICSRYTRGHGSVGKSVLRKEDLGLWSSMLDTTAKVLILDAWHFPKSEIFIGICVCSICCCVEVVLKS